MLRRLHALLLALLSPRLRSGSQQARCVPGADVGAGGAVRGAAAAAGRGAEDPGHGHRHGAQGALVLSTVQYWLLLPWTINTGGVATLRSRCADALVRATMHQHTWLEIAGVQLTY